MNVEPKIIVKFIFEYILNDNINPITNPGAASKIIIKKYKNIINTLLVNEPRILSINIFPDMSKIPKPIRAMIQNTISLIGAFTIKPMIVNNKMASTTIFSVFSFNKLMSFLKAGSGIMYT